MPGLQAGREYEFSVVAMGASGDSLPSEVVAVVTQSDSPIVPFNTTVPANLTGTLRKFRTLYTVKLIKKSSAIYLT